MSCCSKLKAQHTSSILFACTLLQPPPPVSRSAGPLTRRRAPCSLNNKAATTKKLGSCTWPSPPDRQHLSLCSLFCASSHRPSIYPPIYTYFMHIFWPRDSVFFFLALCGGCKTWKLVAWLVIIGGSERGPLRSGGGTCSSYRVERVSLMICL